MRNVSDKRCRENQNTHFVFSNLFSKCHEMGIPLENIPLYTLHFADDQVVLAGDKERFTVLLLLLLLLVFSPWAGLGRDQSSVR